MKGQTVPILVTLWQRINDFALFLEISQQSGFAQLPLSFLLVPVFRQFGCVGRFWLVLKASKRPECGSCPVHTCRYEHVCCRVNAVLLFSGWMWFYLSRVVGSQRWGADGDHNTPHRTHSLFPLRAVLWEETRKCKHGACFSSPFNLHFHWIFCCFIRK